MQWDSLQWLHQNTMAYYAIHSTLQHWLDTTDQYTAYITLTKCAMYFGWQNKKIKLQKQKQNKKQTKNTMKKILVHSLDKYCIDILFYFNAMATDVLSCHSDAKDPCQYIDIILPVFGDSLLSTVLCFIMWLVSLDKRSIFWNKPRYWPRAT